MFTEIRIKVLIIRILLGIGFAVLLSRFFFPNGGWLMIAILAAMLVFGAYITESLRTGKDR